MNNNLELNVYVFCYDDFPHNILTFMAMEEVSFGKNKHVCRVQRARKTLRRKKERDLYFDLNDRCDVVILCAQF